MRCLSEIAAKNSVNAARMLLVGMSNMKHTWRAMTEDDVFPSEASMTAKYIASCGKISHLPSFLPHRIDYTPWLIVQRNFTYLPIGGAHKKTEATCQHSGAIAGPLLQNVVARAAARYHVVACYVGMWDVSFTAFDAAQFEKGLIDGVRHIRDAWPETTIVLFTLTPCGGELPSSAAAVPSTPRGVCALVGCANRAIRRVVETFASSQVQLLDAHQMTTARPLSNVSGTPPGIWLAQRNGWHFQTVQTRHERDLAMARTPPSAAGEMNRALANRLLDMTCPVAAP